MGLSCADGFGRVGSTPILMLSARDGQSDIVACLEIGADDYVTKPFSPREIVSRLGAILTARWYQKGCDWRDGVQRSPSGRE